MPTLLLQKETQLQIQATPETLDGGRAILIHNQSSRHNREDQTARIFAKLMMELMMEGKVRAALRLITQSGSTGPLPLDSLANHNDPASPSWEAPPKATTQDHVHR